MNRFSNCLLVSDYDSTLTDYGGQVPKVNLEAIEYFTAHGGIFTVATGRSLPTARQRLNALPIHAPVLVCNGALCCSPDGSDVLFCHPLPSGCRSVMEDCLQCHGHLVLEVQSLHCHWTPQPAAMRAEWLAAEGAALITGTWDELVQPQINFVLYAPDADPYQLSPDADDARLLARLALELSARAGYEAVHSAPGMLEISAAGVNKGSAARALARKLGRDILICAGDAPNDLSMLQASDLAFVPEGSRLQSEPFGFHSVAPCGQGAIADLIEQLAHLL